MSMEFVLHAQLTLLLVLQPQTELLVYQDFIYQLHGPIVLLAQQELLNVHLPHPSKLALVDIMLLQLLDLMLLVPLVHLLEISQM